MEVQFVATCYLYWQEKFLLLFHPKHNRWLPPGGHLEKGETPPQAARREAFEETGLEISFCLQENAWVEEWNGVSIERPFACLLEEIPARQFEAAHRHCDFIYVAKPIGGSLREGSWLSLEEIEALEDHLEIFVDTKVMARKIHELKKNGAFGALHCAKNFEKQ